uniref:MYND-type domain-containing protein n=1 Tax=Strigamia maritima TaxID=126957 RepID=T1IVL7_STRMM
MRFLQLNKNVGKSPYNTILEFRCEPNFVLNRSELFELMIKEQGLTFWFRFWLTFCFHPGCQDLIAIQELWPEVLSFVKMGIHRRFLQDSHENVCKYCMNEVIRPMLLKSQEKKPFFKKKLPEERSADQLHELVSKCATMAFGSALCEVFFKWLVANYVDDNCQCYWTIPAEYLDPKFKPRLLEEFLVIQWKGNLSKLLGVAKDQVPWVTKLLNGNKDQIFGEDEDKNAYKYNSAKFLQEVVEYIHNKNRNRRNVTGDNGDGEEISTKKTFVPKAFALKPSNSNTMEAKKFRQCSYCKAYEEGSRKFKKCKRCVDEKWKETRYYCDAVCQIDDWYQVHHEEHTRYKEHKLVKTRDNRAKTV